MQVFAQDGPTHDPLVLLLRRNRAHVCHAFVHVLGEIIDDDPLGVWLLVVHTLLPLHRGCSHWRANSPFAVRGRPVIEFLIT